MYERKKGIYTIEERFSREGGNEREEKGRYIGRAGRRETNGTEERMRKGNLAVGQADKPLRDFSLALLSSIDVDSKLPRRKAPLSRAVFGKPRPLLALLIVSAISDDAAVSARRETPYDAILRFRRFTDMSDLRILAILSCRGLVMLAGFPRDRIKHAESRYNTGYYRCHRQTFPRSTDVIREVKIAFLMHLLRAIFAVII